MKNLVPTRVQEGGLIPSPTECCHYIFDGKYLCGAVVPDNAIRGNSEWMKIAEDESEQLTFCPRCLAIWRNGNQFVNRLSLMLSGGE